MAKIWVTNADGSSRVPFLRGILTSSLTAAGLSFEDAYKASSELRADLEEFNEIRRDDLRQRTAWYLEAQYGKDLSAAYLTRGKQEIAIQVRSLDGKLSPFSRTQHLRCLESCGLSDEQAAVVSADIQRVMAERATREIRSCDLGRLTYNYLHKHFGKKTAHRYLVWVAHARSGQPLVVLIGGATGTGKSTIANEVAHRLGIVRIQSTDMLREVMRMMIPERLLPVLHASSFNAGVSLPGAAGDQGDIDAQLADGYLTQAELLSVPCEAVIQRALRERVSVILEGVHLHPGLLKRINVKDSARVIMVMLAMLEPEKMLERLMDRLQEAPNRRASGHLDQFDKIWGLQTFLLSEADKCGIPILVNDDKDKVTNAIMTTLIDTLAKDFSQTPGEVFKSPTSSSRTAPSGTLQ
jgi:2-phosphoglycerate kinase